MHTFGDQRVLARAGQCAVDLADQLHVVEEGVEGVEVGEADHVRGAAPCSLERETAACERRTVCKQTNSCPFIFKPIGGHISCLILTNTDIRTDKIRGGGVEGNDKGQVTETRFSSTNGVSMWCLMVAMMSLKSMAEMAPLLPLSFWAKAWRACSSCSSYTTTAQTHASVGIPVCC